MFTRNKTTVPVQVVIAQNPFAARSNEAIGLSIAELKDISSKLLIVALGHCEQTIEISSKKELTSTHRTKLALILCQHCEKQISAVVSKRAADRSDSRWSPLYESFAVCCREVNENTNASIQYVNAAIDQYKTLHPRAISPAITRIAGSISVIVASWNLSSTNTFLQQHYPWMAKAIAVGVSVIAIPLSFHEVIGESFKNARDVLTRRPKEIPYSMYAARRIGQILRGTDNAANTNTMRPSNKKTAGVKHGKAPTC